jgi:hypothetical protein
VYHKLVRIVLSLTVLLAIGVIPAQAKHLHKENWYVQKYCKGDIEVNLEGTNYRMDCIQDGTSYEFDFVDKRDEAYGQTKRYQYYYGDKYKMGIWLIVEDKKDLNKVIEFMNIIYLNNEDIRVKVIQSYK